jgi:hypothetical protein
MTSHKADVSLFADWLGFVGEEPASGYHVTWNAEPATPNDAAKEALRQYFESAHLDAREYFNKACRLNLHPLGKGGHHVDYPSCLPDNLRKANFGEVMCGAVVETYLMFDKRDFCVPVFLLRDDGQVRNYLMKLRGGREKGTNPGRPGDDFLALELDSDGFIQGVVVGEAKFRGNMPKAKYDSLMSGVAARAATKAKKAIAAKKGILEVLSAETELPVSLFQFADILAEIDAEAFAGISVSVDEMAMGQRLVPRLDLVLLIMGDRAKLTPAPYSSLKVKPSKYTADRPLEIVELHIPNAQTLIDEVYDSVYGGE